MAKVTASVYTSYIAPVGVAWDLKKTAEPYWQPLFEGSKYL
ncbi:protocatechuate 3,4-dioxygenase [Kingella kingae]